MKIFDLGQTGSFSVTDPFLTTFYYVEKRNGILRKNRGEGLKRSYVINECTLAIYVIFKQHRT